jgi:hypothetical protein
MGRLGIVVHTYNPSYLGGRYRRIMIQGQPGQKRETLSEIQTKAKRVEAMVPEP